jgi:hypothetical protein
MRKLVIAVVSGLLFFLCVILGAHGRQTPAKVRFQFVDAANGKKLGGMIRVFPVDAKEPLELPGMLDRLRGLKKTATLKGWYVIPADGAETSLPKQRLRIEALSGLETALVQQEIDLSNEAPETVTIKLNTLFRPEEHGWVAGNTHLHLQGLSKEECEDYLRHVPAADGIRVMFISYLERAEIDNAYITNRYPVGNLKEFEATGVLFNNGEEHRHNFDAWGQGYGHVMFLDIKELVQPVSLGPGITSKGDDDRPLRPGIDEAHRQGGTVLWCHNTFGHESVACALFGRLDAWNVFDGARAGTYEDKYYRCLNVGTRLPISTGTDWFIYDFSRVYARVEEALTIRSWLAALKAGRNVVTNGPLLSLKVDDKTIGDTVSLDKAKKLRIVATGIGRQDFQKLQLVQNGKVIVTEVAQKKGDHFEAKIEREVPVDGPCWLAVRIETDNKNELDQQLFAHTSPVYVEMAGQRFFDVETGRALLKQLEESRDDIRGRGRFSNDAAKDKLLGVYNEAIQSLTKQIGRRSK